MATISQGWRAVTAMFILNGIFFGIWASRVPAVAAKFSLSPGALGLYLLLIGIGAIVSFPFAGRWADRYGAARATLWLAASHVVAVWLVAIAPAPWIFAPALFYFGTMYGGMDVTMNAWAGEVEKRGGRPMMPVFHAMWSIGAGLGAVTGFLAVSAGVGIPLHFVLVATLSGGLALLLARVDWASDIHEHRAGDPVFAFPKSALLAVGIVALGAAVGEGGMGDWSAIFLIRTTGASEASAALGYAVFAVAMVLVRLSGTFVIGRLGPVLTARLAGLSAATGATLAVVVGSYPVALVGFVMMALGYALIIPLAFSRAANDPFITPGRAIASVSTLGYGGILVGPPVIGFVAEATSVRLAFLVIAALALAITLLAGALKPPVQD